MGQPSNVGPERREKQIAHLRFIDGLNMQMATLAANQQVCPGAIHFVSVQVVDGQAIAGGRIMRGPAMLTFPVGPIFHGLGDLRPVIRVTVFIAVQGIWYFWRFGIMTH